jgi:AcrR family transcriptional regulator
MPRARRSPDDSPRRSETIVTAPVRMISPRVAIRKLSADDRIDEIVDAVESLILRDRTLSFGMNQVAKEIAASRALIYVYFESVPQIIDELCSRHLEDLLQRLDHVGGATDVAAFARDVGQHYLDYLVERGPTLHYILRDGEECGALAKSRPLFMRLMRLLVTEARRLLHVQTREALVMVELLSAVPVSLARQIRDGQIDLAVARTTCDRLLADLVADLQVAPSTSETAST